MKRYPRTTAYVSAIIRLVLSLLIVLVCALVPLKKAMANNPNKARIAERLNYFVGTTSFSPSQPLSQERLMELVSEIGYWGNFPNRYKSGITDSGVVRKMKFLTGQAPRYLKGGGGLPPLGSGR